MDFGPLLTFARDLHFTLAPRAVEVEVTAPDATSPTSTRGIWLAEDAEPQTYGQDFARREPRRVLAISRAVVDAAPKGTRITAPESPGTTVKTWIVQGYAQPLSPTEMRVLVRLAME